MVLTCRYEISDVTGERADEAASDIEDAGFQYEYDPQPTDETLCTSAT